MSAADRGFAIPSDHPALAGHFPGRPVVPGVIALAEALALVRPPGGGRATRLRQVKFLAPLLPGQAVQIRAEATAPLSVSFRCFAGEVLVMSGVADFSSAEAAAP